MPSGLEGNLCLIAQQLGAASSEVRPACTVGPLAWAGDDMIEHNAPLAFPTMTLSSLVRGETPSLAHTNPTVDAFAVMCWLLKDHMLKTICAALDEAAYGDKEALSAARADAGHHQRRHAGCRAQRVCADLAYRSQGRGDRLPQ